MEYLNRAATRDSFFMWVGLLLLLVAITILLTSPGSTAHDDNHAIIQEKNEEMAFALLNRCGKVMTKITVNTSPQGLLNEERLALIVQTGLLEAGILITTPQESLREWIRRGRSDIRPPINLEIEVKGGEMFHGDTEGFYFISMFANKGLFDEMTGKSSRAITRRWSSAGVGEYETLESLAVILDGFVSSYLEVNQDYCVQ